MRRAFLISFLATAVIAAEVKPIEPKPVSPANPNPTVLKPDEQHPAEKKPAADIKPVESKPGESKAPKPFLGVRFDDENTVILDQEPGIPISDVVAGSTAQSLGIEKGDRLLTLNDKPTERTADIATILAGAKVGDPVKLEYVHNGTKTMAQGALAERPKPATLAKDVDRLNQKLAEVKDLADSQKREPTLAEILQQLKDIEAGLPRAVAAFKKQFPDGEFDIRLQVVITSDKNAKNPVEFSNQGAKLDAKKAELKKPDEKKVDEKKVDEKKPETKDAKPQPAPK